jgi:hypothetical protein
MNPEEKQVFFKLLNDHFRAGDTHIVREWIDAHPQGMDLLMSICLGNDALEGARATRIAKLYQIDQPDCFLPWLNQMIEAWPQIPHPGARREIIRTIRDFATWPTGDELGLIADLAFQALERVTEPVAVHVYAMDLAERVCLSYPEFEDELELVLDRLAPIHQQWYKVRVKRWKEKRQKRSKKGNQSAKGSRSGSQK